MFATAASADGPTGVWNQVFSGVSGAPAQSYPNPTYTTLATTPVSREKPFLYIDNSGNYNVFVPAVQKNSTGVSWSGSGTPGRSRPINNFFIAKPITNVEEINLALLLGKSLILTPGVYQLQRLDPRSLSQHHRPRPRPRYLGSTDWQASDNSNRRRWSRDLRADRRWRPRQLTHPHSTGQSAAQRPRWSLRC